MPEAPQFDWRTDNVSTMSKHSYYVEEMPKFSAVVAHGNSFKRAGNKSYD